MTPHRGRGRGTQRLSKRVARVSVDSVGRSTSDTRISPIHPPEKDEIANHDSSTECASDAAAAPDYEVEKVVDKKIFEGKTYYKLKWIGWEELTWEREEDCSCDLLIQEYERLVDERCKDEEEDEWEVEEILDKRIEEGKTEYQVRWKNWSGSPTWVREEDCACVNLIAAFENPKLRKMWNFHGSNTKLWLDRDSMIRYMRKYARLNGYKVNLLKFDPDFPENEKPCETLDGINIGPLCYKSHWYLVIIIVNYICITKKLLVCDPLNTLIGVPNTRVHPVYKRMTKVYSKFTVSPIAMTPMERSDMCAFYVLAGYERALFCLNEFASFIVNKLYFDHSRPELIRSQIAPVSEHEISVNLLNNGSFLDGPKCEFCGRLAETGDLIDKHIRDEHFSRVQMSVKVPMLSPSPKKTYKKGEGISPEMRKRSATDPDAHRTPNTKRKSTRNYREMSSL